MSFSSRAIAAALSLFSFSALSQTVLPKTTHKIVVIAHRGNHVSVPENTLASYQEAINCGADYVEVDVRATKDGHLVVMHDGTVDRTTNGSGKVADMTFEQIRALKVFNNNKKTHRVPEFQEVLQVCKGKINIYLDFKDGDIEKTWKLIREAGMEHHVIVYLNKKEQYAGWQAVAPHVPLMTSAPDEVKNPQQLAAFLDHMHVSVLDNVHAPEMLHALHAHKGQAWLDVQSRTEGPESWEKVLAHPVDGLQTDHPAQLIKYLEEKGLR